MVDASSFDVVVAGGGPAGIAAACAAAGCGASVALIDENPEYGGQIWRRDVRAATYGEALPWMQRLKGSPVRCIQGTKIVDGDAKNKILQLENATGYCTVHWKKLILATGARERFLPFPGWTLPGVLGAGGLQAMVKSGLDTRDSRVVVAGTGPLLLAVAAYLRHRGARVLMIVEQAPLGRLVRFAARSLRFGKAGQAFALGFDLRGVPFRTGAWVEAAHGSERLTGVTVRSGNERREHGCDYLAIGYGLVPNVELAVVLGCELEHGFVRVGPDQATSVTDVYAAGEIAGIAGLDAALDDGQIAGSLRTGDASDSHAFRVLLAETFALREELRNLPDADTLVCRCEDVPFHALKEFSSWREAKLQTRCGMGACQGRICGPAVEFLKGWTSSGVRPPILPARVETIAGR